MVLAGTPVAAAMMGEPVRGANSSKAIWVSWMSIHGARRVGSSCGCSPPALAVIWMVILSRSISGRTVMSNLHTPRRVVPSAEALAS